MSGGVEGLNWVAAVWGSWMIGMAWQATAVVVLVSLLTLALRKSSASLRHLLWLLIFVKLVVPPSAATPWSPGNWLSKVRINVETASPHKTPGAVEATIPDNDTTPLTAARASLAIPPVSGTAAASVRLKPVAIAFLAWAAIAAGLFGAFVFQWQSYARRMKKDLIEAPEQLRRTLDGLAGAMGLRQRVSLGVSVNVATPAVMGLWRPMVLLPSQWQADFSMEELSSVLAHELAHVKRGDIPLGFLASFLLCVYWFHPAAWLANLFMRREREMACDDKALALTRQDGRQYASTILHVAESFRAAVPVGAGLLGLIELSDNLLSRIRSVGDGLRARRIGWNAVPALLLVLLMLPLGQWRATAAGKDAPSASEPQDEIAKYYSKTDAETQSHLRSIADKGAAEGIWLSENTFASLSADDREAKVVACIKALEGDYSRDLCPVLAEAGALADKRLVSGLLKIATFKMDQQTDNRVRWMAVAALGRIGDETVVPTLVKLLSHYNHDTRVYAQAGLARITAQGLGADPLAWAAWWNNSAKQPQIDLRDLKQYMAAQTAILAEFDPPQVAETVPKIGADDVDPSLAEIRATFDKDMGGGFSWTGGGDYYPKMAGKPRWIDKRTCALPVQLEPGHFYRVGINSSDYRNFRSTAGTPAPLGVVYFATKGAGPDVLAALAPPKVVKMAPPYGAKVAPSLTQLAVTFDKPMGGGFSWCKTGGKNIYPDTEGQPKWSEDQKTCILAVKLKPSTFYVVGLNHVEANNFQSSFGVPLEPVLWEFSTGE